LLQIDAIRLKLHKIFVSAPKLHVVQDLSDTVIDEGATARFNVQLSKENVGGNWFLNGLKLSPRWIFYSVRLFFWKNIISAVFLRCGEKLLPLYVSIPILQLMAVWSLLPDKLAKAVKVLKIGIFNFNWFLLFAVQLCNKISESGEKFFIFRELYVGPESYACTKHRCTENVGLAFLVKTSLSAV